MPKTTGILTISLGLSSLLLAGCGGSTADPGDADGTCEAVTLSAGHVYPADSIPHSVLESLSELVDAGSDGRITIDAYPAGQMGDDRELQEALQFGAMDIIVTGASMIEGSIPEYGSVGAPYVFRDWDHIDAVLGGDLGDEMNAALLDEAGVRMVGYSQRGTRQLTANREIQTPEDASGLLLRTPNNATTLAVWSSIGASPTPLDWGEVYTSLQQGVIEAQENPLDLIESSRLYEVQSHLMLTNHLVNPYWYFANENRLTELCDEDREVLLSSLDEATSEGTERGLAFEEELLQVLQDEGMEVVEPDVAAFSAKAEEYYAESLDGNEFEFYQRVLDQE